MSMSEDLTCVLRRKRGWFDRQSETVICGQSIVERYLRGPYEFDWQLTDLYRAKPTPCDPTADDRG